MDSSTIGREIRMRKEIDTLTQKLHGQKLETVYALVTKLFKQSLN